MQMLGHRNINNTIVYTRLIDFTEDDYIARIARLEEEVYHTNRLRLRILLRFPGK